MLSRSGIILFYFLKWAYLTVNEMIVKGTPRVGHPVKEGLRLPLFQLFCNIPHFPEWVIQ